MHREDNGRCMSVVSDFVVLDTSGVVNRRTSQQRGEDAVVLMDGIWLCWEQSDLMTTGKTTPTAQTPPINITTAATSTLWTGTGREPHSQPLTKGATAGITIGSLAFLILLLSALLALLRYLRARRDNVCDHPSNLADFLARGRLKRRSRQGPAAGGLQEMEGKGRPAEADAGNVRAELEGEWRGNEMGQDR